MISAPPASACEAARVTQTQSLVGGGVTIAATSSCAPSAPRASRSSARGETVAPPEPTYADDQSPWGDAVCLDPELCQDRRPQRPTAAPPAPAQPGTAGVTIADVATFVPSPPSATSEPASFGVVGLETNFIASSASQVVPGTLLGQPAEVRFTPRGYLWGYGDPDAPDAAPRETSTGGATWQALGLEEFDRTPTSHVYEERGTVTVRTAVVYSAEYRLAAMPDFVAIPGTLTVPAPPRDLRIVTIRTVLVAEDCIANPRGPGC